MSVVMERKIKLEQKKARLVLEEVKLKIQERKKRTRQLIELGGLVVKAKLDHLSSNTLYGALLSLQDSTSDANQLKVWTELGANNFEAEEKTRTAVILTLKQKPENNIRDLIRQHGLRWNKIRQEWAGYVQDLESLKTNLAGLEYELQII